MAAILEELENQPLQLSPKERGGRADTALVHHDKCAIQYIQKASFDKQNGKPLFDGDGLKRRKKGGHATKELRRREISLAVTVSTIGLSRMM